MSDFSCLYRVIHLVESYLSFFSSTDGRRDVKLLLYVPTSFTKVGLLVIVFSNLMSGFKKEGFGFWFQIVNLILHLNSIDGPISPLALGCGMHYQPALTKKEKSAWVKNQFFVVWYLKIFIGFKKENADKKNFIWEKKKFEPLKFSVYLETRFWIGHY